MPSLFEGITFEADEPALVRAPHEAWAAGADAVVAIAHECPEVLAPIVERHPELHLSFVGAGGSGQPLVGGGDAPAAATRSSTGTASSTVSGGGSPSTSGSPPAAHSPAPGHSPQPKSGPAHTAGAALAGDSSASTARGEPAAIAMAPAPGRAPAGGAGPRELPLMPAPPTALSSKELGRVGGVHGRARAAATAIATARPAGDNIALARTAVAVPQKESDAHAAQQVVAALAERQPPSPEILKLCDRIRELIREKRPADEDAVIDTRPQEVAAQAGGAIEGDVKHTGDQVQAAYGGIEPNPTGPTPPEPPPIPAMPAHVATAPVNATAARPDAVPPAQVSLDADSAEMTARAKDAGLEGETAQLVQSGPVADARAARGEMAALGKDGPAEALAQQKAALARADGDMAALQAEALAALQATRTGHVTSVKGQQDELKGGDEALRVKLATEATVVYEDAQQRVEHLLKSVHDVAMQKWSARLPVISKRFNDDLKVVTDEIEERHSGVGGWFVSGWDAVTGLPSWVNRAYDRAEKNFGDGVCNLIDSSHLIADQFGGSGYAASANLISASENYNRIEMRRVEEEIVGVAEGQ